MEYLNHPLARLAMGVLLALLVFVYRTVTKKDLSLGQELGRLVPPALLVGAGMLYAGASYMDATAATLTALGVALGLNSNRRAK